MTAEEKSEDKRIERDVAVDREISSPRHST
jgi:hypothetical protein